MRAAPLLQTAAAAKVVTRFCQHRWPAIAGMVGFRNNVGNARLTEWVSPSSQRIAFARGTYHGFLFSRSGKSSRRRGTDSLGFVAINNEDSVWRARFSTSLPGGSYCNVFDGMPDKTGSCSGTVYVVENAPCHFRHSADFIHFVPQVPDRVRWQIGRRRRSAAGDRGAHRRLDEV